jgi:tellurite resistance protein TehA-like permease
MGASDLHRHPAWFGAVMGTSGLSLAFYQESFVVLAAAFEVTAVALLVASSVLALVLLPRYLSRPRDRAALALELAHPAQGAALATFPGGLLVLAVNWSLVGSMWLGSVVGLLVSAILAIAGAVIAVGLSVLWATAQGAGDGGLGAVNGGWLIPPAITLLVPVCIAPQMVAHPDYAAPLLVLGLAFYGIGAFLVVAVFSLVVARLALRPRIAAAQAPSMWVPLAPAGMLGVAMLRLTQAGAQTGALPEASIMLGIVVSAMGIGLGLWWALLALGDLVRVRRDGGVPFHPGWWGFVFPIAAMQLSLSLLGAQLANDAIQAAGLVGLAVLLAVWLTVATRTWAAVVRHARAARA